MRHLTLSLWLIGLIVALSSINRGHMAAEETAKPKTDSEQTRKAGQDQATIDSLVAQLDHAQLTKREEARRALMKAGRSAIPALAKAALSGKRSLIEKSIDILAKLSQSDDEETKDAAKVTLEMLSESEQPSTAERAKLVLESKTADEIQPFQGGDQFNNQFGGGARSVSVSNVNGRRSVTVQEGGTETTVEELANGKIHVTITGGDEPVELLVKNLDELKKKSPEAFAIFQQHAGNGAGTFGKGMPNIKAVAGGNGGAIFQQNGPAAGAGSSAMLVNQLQELKQRFAGNSTMQQMLDQQIKLIEKNQKNPK
jgi:hypothetical protein